MQCNGFGHTEGTEWTQFCVIEYTHDPCNMTNNTCSLMYYDMNYKYHNDDCRQSLMSQDEWYNKGLQYSPSWYNTSAPELNDIRQYWSDWHVRNNASMNANQTHWNGTNWNATNWNGTQWNQSNWGWNESYYGWNDTHMNHSGQWNDSIQIDWDSEVKNILGDFGVQDADHMHHENPFCGISDWERVVIDCDYFPTIQYKHTCEVHYNVNPCNMTNFTCTIPHFDVNGTWRVDDCRNNLLNKTEWEHFRGYPVWHDKSISIQLPYIHEHWDTYHGIWDPLWWNEEWNYANNVYGNYTNFKATCPSEQ